MDASNGKAGKMERFLRGEQVYDGKLLKVYRDEVSVDGAKDSVREYIRHRGAVCVAPLDEQGRLWFVRQFRYPLGRDTLELPAGKLDGDEDPADAAARELSEETGFTAERLLPIGSILPSPAYTTEEIFLFLADGLTAGDAHPDEGEVLDAFPLPLEEAVEMAMDGRIRDAKTVASVLKINEMLRRQET